MSKWWITSHFFLFLLFKFILWFRILVHLSSNDTRLKKVTWKIIHVFTIHIVTSGRHLAPSYTKIYDSVTVFLNNSSYWSTIKLESNTPSGCSRDRKCKTRITVLREISKTCKTVSNNNITGITIKKNL